MTGRGQDAAAPTAQPALEHCTVQSPFGAVELVAGSRGIRAVLLPGEDRIRLAGALGPPLSTEPAEPDSDPAAVAARLHLDRAALQLAQYLAGERREFDVALDPHGTAFQLRAWQVLRDIPFGTTISYRDQAAALGNPGATRAVGAANGRNPIPVLVPCHRVIGSSGKLTGYTGGLSIKEWLLDHERHIHAG